MGRHSGSHTGVQQGIDGLPDDGSSGVWAVGPEQTGYDPVPGCDAAGWPAGDTGGAFQGGYGYAEPDTGYHGSPTHTGFADPGVFGGYGGEQHTGAHGYDTYAPQQQGWEHPAPAAVSGTWSAPGTMQGAPAHWDDPLEPYAVPDASGTYGALGHAAVQGYPADPYAADPYAVDPYAVGPYPADAYDGAAHLLDGPIAGMPAAPSYDTTTFEPQSFVGYGYDASGAYPVVALPENPLTDVLYDMPVETVPDEPGAGRYAMASEPWAASPADLEPTSFVDDSSKTPAAEPLDAADALYEPQRAGRRRAGSVPAPTPAPVGRANTRRANRPAPRRGRRTLVAAGGAIATGAVLAGAVALQMPDEGSTSHAAGEDQAAPGTATRTDDPATSRSNDREGALTTAAPGGASSVPMPTATSPTTTDQLTVRFPLDPKLALGGDFETVAGKQSAPDNGGRTYTYRVEIEDGLQLDGTLFATTVQKTLNDPRSWAHDQKTFVRVDSGKSDFVVRLSSPETLHGICTPIVGDTSENNVSCDAHGTPYVMINAWRWAQGSTAYGDDILGYRQMLINHEVGHRIGHNHETSCDAAGLAPVMMQQTKSREATTGSDAGETCKANPWPYPTA